MLPPLPRRSALQELAVAICQLMLVQCTRRQIYISFIVVVSNHCRGSRNNPRREKRGKRAAELETKVKDDGRPVRKHKTPLRGETRRTLLGIDAIVADDDDDEKTTKCQASLADVAAIASVSDVVL